MGFASRLANADGICRVTQVVLYYVCVATTYSPLLYREISPIIRFFLTQNQSTLSLTKKILASFSSCGACTKHCCSFLEAIAITLQPIFNLKVVSIGHRL